MKIQTESPTAAAGWDGFSNLIQPLFTERFGPICLFLFLTLIITEDCCLNAAHKEKAEVICRLANLFGLCLIIGAAWAANRSYNRCYRQCVNGTTCVPYLTLTDEYVEEGVLGLWHQRFSWEMFKGFKERDDRFILRRAVDDAIIKKRDLKLSRFPSAKPPVIDDAAIKKRDLNSDPAVTALRVFLAGKMPAK